MKGKRPSRSGYPMGVAARPEAEQEQEEPRAKRILSAARVLRAAERIGASVSRSRRLSKRRTLGRKLALRASEKSGSARRAVPDFSRSRGGARCAPSGVAGCSPQRPRDGLPEGRTGERTGLPARVPGISRGAFRPGTRRRFEESSRRRPGSRTLARYPCEARANQPGKRAQARILRFFLLFLSPGRKNLPAPTLTGVERPRQPCHACGSTDQPPSMASPRSRVEGASPTTPKRCANARQSFATR